MTQNREDADIVETEEWLAALASLIKYEGPERAQFMLNTLLENASQRGVAVSQGLTTPYQNTIPLAQQPEYPGNLAL